MLSERDPAEDVGGQPLLSLVLLERLLPVRRGEGEDAGLGPGRQQAEEVPQIPHRLDSMHLATRQQGHEERVGAGPVVAADEEPVLATDGLATERALRDIVVEGQAPVVQKALQRFSLVACIGQRGRDGRAIEGERRLLVAPREEGC